MEEMLSRFPPWNIFIWAMLPLYPCFAGSSQNRARKPARVIGELGRRGWMTIHTILPSGVGFVSQNHRLLVLVALLLPGEG